MLQEKYFQFHHSIVHSYLMNVLANFHKNPANLHTPLICSSRGNSCKKNHEYLTSKEITVFAPHWRACQSGHASVQWNTTLNPIASLVIKNSFEIYEKGHFTQRGTWVTQNLKFIGKNRRKSGQSKLGKKKNSTFIYLAWALSQLSSFC